MGSRLQLVNRTEEGRGACRNLFREAPCCEKPCCEAQPPAAPADDGANVDHAGNGKPAAAKKWASEEDAGTDSEDAERVSSRRPFRIKEHYDWESSPLELKRRYLGIDECAIYGREIVGREVAVYSRKHLQWCKGRILSFREQALKHRVKYDHGWPADEEDLTLSKEWFQFLSPTSKMEAANPTYGKGFYPKGRAAVGQDISIYWPGMGAWYKAQVMDYDETKRMHSVSYVEGKAKPAWIRMKHEVVRFLNPPPETKRKLEQHHVTSEKKRRTMERSAKTEAKACLEECAPVEGKPQTQTERVADALLILFQQGGTFNRQELQREVLDEDMHESVLSHILHSMSAMGLIDYEPRSNKPVQWKGVKGLEEKIDSLMPDDSRFLGGTAKNASAAKERQEERKEERNDPGDRMVLCKEVVEPKSGGWSNEEDEKIIAMVKEHREKLGRPMWRVIANNLPGRDHCQCCRRWRDVLHPNIHKGPWGEDEDKILIDAHKKFGNKWAEISKLLPGRPGNTVMNRWRSLMKRKFEEGGSGGGGGGGGGPGSSSRAEVGSEVTDPNSERCGTQEEPEREEEEMLDTESLEDHPEGTSPSGRSARKAKESGKIFSEAFFLDKKNHGEGEVRPTSDEPDVTAAPRESVMLAEGTRVEIKYDNPPQYFQGVVIGQNKEEGTCLVRYAEDGVEEYINFGELESGEWRALPRRKRGEQKVCCAHCLSSLPLVTEDSLCEACHQFLKRVRQNPGGSNIIGKRIDVLFASPRQYFRGTIIRYDPDFGTHFIMYDDGDSGDVNLDKAKNVIYKFP